MGRRYNSGLCIGVNGNISFENFELYNLLMKQAAYGDANFADPNTNNFKKNISKRRDIDPNGLFDFAAHGSPYSMDIYVNGKNHEDQDWRVIANIIKHSKGYHGQDIRLLSCNVGMKPDGFAQNLANKLNVNVYASDTIYWAYPSGAHFSANKSIKGDEPDFSSRHNLIKFTPNKRRRNI